MSTRRRRPHLLSTIILLLLVSTGCSADDPSDGQGEVPTGRFVEDDNPNHVFEFLEDGTYLYDEADFVGGDPDVAGVSGVRGELYTEMTHDYSRAQPVPVT